ncbi:MAG: MATE family efflux transporter [Acidobacteria bacterium]|jgi:putative MATE family efflux protein|nr:MATE family efflux transporter [Acidobacteriota bacterium]
MAGEPQPLPKPAQKKFDRRIIDGPLRQAVWMLAWPTMLQNIFGGLQGVIDHSMVGHYVGLNANAAIGVSLQIFILVIVFVASVFSGMGVLVARFAGAGDSDAVNRTVYQAFLTAAFLSTGLLAPVGYFAAPWLLSLVNAAPDVQREALPYIRTMFVSSIGMLTFFMMSGALRAAGDVQTTLRTGVAMTIANVILNILLIPKYGTFGAALGTAIASVGTSGVLIWLLFSGRLVIRFSRGMSFKPDWPIIRELFRFGLPTGIQGIAMNLAGLLMVRFIGSLQHSAEAQAAYAVGYTELFSLITWTSVGLMGAAAAVAGQNLGAGHPDRAAQSPAVAARIGLGVAAIVGLGFVLMPRVLLGAFALTEGVGFELGRELLAYLAVSGFFVTVALCYTGGLQGTGDTKSPLYISIVSQVIVPVGLCSVIEATGDLAASDIWLAIVLGHATRATLSVLRFQQGKWRNIRVAVPRPAAE